MKYTIKITKEIPTAGDEKYPRQEDIYEQSLEIYLSTDVFDGVRTETNLVQDVIKAVNEIK